MAGLIEYKKIAATLDDLQTNGNLTREQSIAICGDHFQLDIAHSLSLIEEHLAKMANPVHVVHGKNLAKLNLSALESLAKATSPLTEAEGPATSDKKVGERNE